MAVAEHHVQGSEAWLEYRRTRGGASEAAALFNESPFMPKNAQELFEVKTGQREVYVTDAMKDGHKYEPAARAKLEQLLDEPLMPKVVEYAENERIIASLDGQTFDGKTIIEVKCPKWGRQSQTWREVDENGKPGRHYWIQIQQQLLCSGATYCLFAVYDHAADDMITTQVDADPDFQKRIVSAWEWFFKALDAGEAPHPERTDEEWKIAAEAYKRAKANLEQAKADEEAAKKALIELTDEGDSGFGVKVTKYLVKGSIDYKAAVPEGVDLDRYRKPGRLQTRVTVEEKS
ncbi:lambda-exonuclease family protein [Spiribacter onubensis]|uniref:YqaJ viral recombinase family protein n=1 Tax=Spiribacter onubensis TaxID=3122420 RepID=A0ABV3S9V6_9GAMM